MKKQMFGFLEEVGSLKIEKEKISRVHLNP